MLDCQIIVKNSYEIKLTIEILFDLLLRTAGNIKEIDGLKINVNLPISYSSYEFFKYLKKLRFDVVFIKNNNRYIYKKDAPNEVELIDAFEIEINKLLMDNPTNI